MDVVATSKLMYEQFLDDEDRAKVEEMDVPDQAYFWTMLYYEVPRHMGKSMLREMERDVIDGKAIMRPVIRAMVRRSKTLDGLWDTTRPHAWFKPSLIQ